MFEYICYYASHVEIRPLFRADVERLGRHIGVVVVTKLQKK